MPLLVKDANGKVVFQGKVRGAEFRANLPAGRYLVTTRWDDWSFARVVTVGPEDAPVVFAWDDRGASASSTG